MHEDTLPQLIEDKRSDGWRRLSCYLVTVYYMDMQKTREIKGRAHVVMVFTPSLMVSAVLWLLFPSSAVASQD